MVILIQTDDYRGDHAADVERLLTIPDDMPVSELRKIAIKHGTRSGQPATIKIVAHADYALQEDRDDQ